jgi:hypothetical protein
MTTLTYTETYTRVDVAKVFENFAADLRLIARMTALWTDDYASSVAEDVSAFAEEEYLSEIHIVLAGTSGRPVQVHEYKVSKNASGWTVQRPGGNVWPQIEGGSLQVILKYSPVWGALNTQEQAEFKAQLNVPWSPSKVDTTYPGLTATGTRKYASNAFGLGRTTREKK